MEINHPIKSFYGIMARVVQEKIITSIFENVSHDRCIICNQERTEIARTDFTNMFSEFEYNTGFNLQNLLSR